MLAMDSSTPAIPKSRSRRSIPNLATLNIAPLSSNYPLEPSDLSPHDPGTATPHASYIQGRSAPTTPGILSLSQSRSQSRPRRHRNSGPDLTHDGYFASVNNSPPHNGDDNAAAALTKAKSTTALLSPTTLAAHKTQPSSSSNSKPHHKRSQTTASHISPDWIHHAGLAIASSTRDEKGTTWLVSRDSATALASPTAYAGPPPYDDHPGTRTPRARAHRSLPGSRLPSAYPSRRGSRVGSKTDVAGMNNGAHTPVGSGPSALSFEPDFVDPEDDTDSDSDRHDEAEVSRLAREQSLGLGGWVDWLVGRTLFRVNEDGENESDDEDEDDAAAQQEDPEIVRRKQALDAERRRRDRERIVAASAGAMVQGKETEIAPIEAPQEEGGWKDAAWLLSVASKIIL